MAFDFMYMNNIYLNRLHEQQLSTIAFKKICKLEEQ